MPAHRDAAATAQSPAEAMLDRMQQSTLALIPVHLIDPSPFQPRLDFGDIESLAKSILETGMVVQPIIVRPSGARYEIIAGERRLRAAKIAGLIQIPSVVQLLNDEVAAKITLAENLSRKDLADFEIAKSLKTMMALDPKLSQSQCGKFIGRSQMTVSRLLAFFDLPETSLQILEASPGCLSATFINPILDYIDDGHLPAVEDALRLAALGQIKDGGIVKYIDHALADKTQNRSCSIKNKNNKEVARCTALKGGGYKIQPVGDITSEEIFNAILAAISSL